MTRHSAKDCLDLEQPGEFRVELEVGRGGEITLSCPCCEGSGEHADRPGNDPMTLHHQCWTCEGKGVIVPDLSIGPASWPGASINGKLKIRPNRRERNSWHIHGGRESDNATGSTKAVLELAHRIIDNLERTQGISQLRWVKEYRTLLPSATLEEATHAYLKEHPEPEKARA